MTDAPLRRTPLYPAHVDAGAKLVDFAGWEMPLNYGSQMVEHRAVREHAGMFDVSHMTVIDVTDGAGGGEALALLRRLLANDVAKLGAPGQALYGVMLNDEAGIVDDLIVYRRDAGYRAVVNAATRDKVLAWLADRNDEGARIEERDLAMVAVQGPAAIELFETASGWTDVTGIAPFSMREQDGWMVGRTGYTGEDGVEVVLPGDAALALWGQLADAGVRPAGLAARDTLRLEAGLNLYGQDMDETTSPLVSNLAWTVAWEPEARDFIGRAALARERAAGPASKLTGLVMEEKGVLRHGQRVVTESGEGEITSGIFSPTLGYSIALARLPRAAKGACEVDVRGRLKPARIVRPPFVRKGSKVFD
ncbi:MAG: glycine cleavage system protein T [Gammaproteobacteria bacterium]|nr:glycine cleavage system protein T [Gammaproteobacteria bacterium]|tara:strand:- start:2666 stop:3757 length:1092 start_codon:yes stop_codon:yes gene_type:complete